jgi:hypothetical protein
MQHQLLHAVRLWSKIPRDFDRSSRARGGEGREYTATRGRGSPWASRSEAFSDCCLSPGLPKAFSLLRISVRNRNTWRNLWTFCCPKRVIFSDSPCFPRPILCVFTTNYTFTIAQIRICQDFQFRISAFLSQNPLCVQKCAFCVYAMVRRSMPFCVKTQIKTQICVNFKSSDLILGLWSPA